MKSIVCLVALLGSCLAFAASDVETQLRQLEVAYSQLQQEQTSVFQEFQMTTELRRAAIQEANQPPPQYSTTGTLPNYDDRIQAQRRVQQQIDQYTTRLGFLQSRFQELGEEKRRLGERMSALAARLNPPRQ